MFAFHGTIICAWTIIMNSVADGKTFSLDIYLSMGSLA